jgi:hypothetical protein
MKSQDIVILLKLVSLEREAQEPSARPGGHSHDEDPYTVRALGSALGIGKTEINASIKRSVSSGLAVKDPATDRPKANRRNLYKFIVNGLRFVFPAKPGAMTRGIPTAFAAPPLKSLLISAGEYIHVWPYARGKDMGQSIEPLFRSVPEAVGKDDRLYEYLALIDGIRLGNPREAGLAAERLSERLLLKK